MYVTEYVVSLLHSFIESKNIGDDSTDSTEHIRMLRHLIQGFDAYVLRCYHCWQWGILNICLGRQQPPAHILTQTIVLCSLINHHSSACL